MPQSLFDGIISGANIPPASLRTVEYVQHLHGVIPCVSGPGTARGTLRITTEKQQLCHTKPLFLCFCRFVVLRRTYSEEMSDT